MKVKSIWVNGHIALIEGEVGKYHRRVIVPAREVLAGDCPLSVFTEGIPWGADFEANISVGPLSRIIADELRKRGIWTYEDAMSRPSEVRASFALAGVGLMGDFLRAAKEEVRNGRKDHGPKKQ